MHLVPGGARGVALKLKGFPVICSYALIAGLMAEGRRRFRVISACSNKWGRASIGKSGSHKANEAIR